MQLKNIIYIEYGYGVRRDMHVTFIMMLTPFLNPHMFITIVKL